MSSQEIVGANANESQRALFAAGVALGLHLLLLLVSPFSTEIKLLSSQAQQAISIQLEPTEVERQVEEPTPQPLPVIEPKAKPLTAPIISVEPISLDSEEDKRIVVPITAATLLSFAKRETDQILRHNSRALSDFKATFIEPVAETTPEQTSFENVYGETHVVTKIGDKQVCYMQGEQHPRDEWSQGLVMFYSCAPKEKFTLELP